MTRKTSMLHHLEVLAQGKEGPGYPISPKLLDTTRLMAWRRNLVIYGSNEHRLRLTHAVSNNRVRKTLDLDVLEGNHGS